jgi:diguanylate cyclase (GGDEF)-like protein/PAS domain S-box-containing protein
MRFPYPAIVRLGLFILVYFLLAKISVVLATDPANTFAVWAGAGFSLAIMMIHGMRMWPVPLLGATLSLLHVGLSPGPALMIGLGNMFEALIATWLIKRHTRIATCFTNSMDVFLFIKYAAAGALVASLVGPTVQLIAGRLSMINFPLSWFLWFLGDVSGIAVFAPALITWHAPSSTVWDRKKTVEVCLFSLAFVFCGLSVFAWLRAPLLFLMTPFLIWLAFRFSQKEIALANIALVVMASVGILNGRAPFLNLPFKLLLLQVFISVEGVTALAMAVVIDERRRTTRELKNLRAQLEQQVQHRTTQLHHAIQALELDIAKREEIQHALRAKEMQLEEAQRLAHMGSWEWDAINDRLVVSNEMHRIYGIPENGSQTLTYKQYLQYIPPDECHLVDAVVAEALQTRQDFTYEHHIVRPDGTQRYLRCSGSVKTDESGKPVKLYGTAHDVTEAHAMQSNLREAEELYRKLVELSPDAIYLLHRGRITFTNEAGLKMANVADDQQLAGQEFIELICPSDRKTVTETLQQMAQHKQVVSVEGRIERKDNSRVDFELAATPFGIQRKHDTLLVVRDISERKRIEQQIYHLAHHDPLTGLANRLLFKERLQHTIAQAHRAGTPLAVLFVDLDRFKLINDTAGHGAGDRVLLECAHRLRQCLRDSDTVARTGGDEFLILIEAPAGPLHVPSVAQKVITALEQPFYVGGKEFSIGASIGISTYPGDGSEVEILIQNADIAMYRAKTEGRGCFRFYSATMAAQSLQRYRMEAALRRALDRHEMELYFQPKINLQSGRISGAEALIRWHHPEFGMLLPQQFIPVAEDMGMIDEIGLWAIRETCSHCRNWQLQGLPTVRIAVNLAYSQFTDERFCSKVSNMLDNAGLEPSVLELEITETMVMENAERLMSMLLELRRHGIHLSVDDFGTGYSSLAYLKRLPVDSVKVDRSFIKDLPSDSEDVAITHAVLALVHSLKRTVVAEGVETREQLQFLVENGCEEGQGFYFSRPLPAQEFSEFLAKETVFAV